MVQSMTGGDDGPGNGRVEAEIGQLKRRLRATLAQSGLPQTFWPCCARHVGEARLRQQLTKLGVPCRPMPIFASNVVVKTKRWHKSGQLSDPFRPMQLMGPSPLMTNGWVVRTEDQIQHARAVVVTDPLSHTAHVELQIGDNPGKPSHRHHGKQPLDGVENPLKNLFPIEAPSMAELHPEGAADDLGLHHEHDPLPELQLEEDDYSPESPALDVEELALRQLRARGESFRSFGDCEPGLKKCVGCGLDQPSGTCGFCGDDMPGPGELQPTIWRLDRGKDDLIHEQDLQNHWNLKKLWNQQLATPAVGDQAGSVHGGFLEWLERDLRQMEEDLEIQGEEIHGVRLAALQAGSKGAGEDQPQPAAVLQTYTVPLSAVRKELSEWKDAMAAELKSLLETTKAIRKVDESELVKFPNYKDMEMAPAKVVATVKAPSGRRKVRVVICGNLLEKIHQGQEDGAHKSAGLDETSRFAQYAGGVDGTTLRCVLRKASANQWAVATTDVRTAFLLAPRQNHRLLVCHPPRVLIEAGLCSPTERWVVDGAMYGLPESPKDWGCYRDVHVSTFKWTLEKRGYQLRRTPEPNVWYVVREGQGDDDPEEVCGFVTIYVDDILTAPEPIAQAAMNRIKQEWTCSDVEWVTSSSWTKFCGMEIRREGDALLVGQPSYIKELLERHEPSIEQSSPMPANLDDTPEPDPEVKDIRLAQAIVGELLWTSVRTRPDLCYGVAWMGRMVTKCPKRVLQYGKHMMSYLKKTSGLCLRYGEWAGGFGQEEELAFARTSTCLEVFCDASYGVSGGKGQTGVITCYGGAPVHWQSKQQPFGTLSTTECELVGYAEAFTLGEAAASLVNILEQNKLEDEGVKVLYGDSQSGMLLLRSPDGAHRARHLRLRHFVLRIRLGDWLARYMPGKGLMSDLLTKPIVTRGQWTKFYDFLGMVDTTTQSGDDFPSSVGATMGPSVAKIAGCVAALGALASWGPRDDGSKIAKAVGLVAVAAYTAKLVGGSMIQKTSKKDLKRAARLAVKPAAPGPNVASPRAEAPGLGGEVKTKKVSRLDELAPHGNLSRDHEPDSEAQIKALRLPGPRPPVNSCAEAMDLGPQFSFWPLSDDRFRLPPATGKDSWESLGGGWWVKTHREMRVKAFHPMHSTTPFKLELLVPSRYTLVFWKSRDGGWCKQAHCEPWMSAPKVMAPKEEGATRTTQWVGYTFFRVDPEKDFPGAGGHRAEAHRQGEGQPAASSSSARGALLDENIVQPSSSERSVLPTSAVGPAPQNSTQELKPPGQIPARRGGPIERARAAGPLYLRGSIARSFPGGVLPSRTQEMLSLGDGHPGGSGRDQGPQLGAYQQEMIAPTRGAYVPSAYQVESEEVPYRQEEGRRVGAERGESETRESDPVTEMSVVTEQVDPYGYMLGHVRDLAEDMAWTQGLPIPAEGVPYAGAIDIPPANGTRPRLASLGGNLHGQYFNAGLFVPRSPPAFSDTMSEPGEAIERLLNPTPAERPRRRRVPAHHPEWVPPPDGGADVEIVDQVSQTESDDDGGFELLLDE